MSTSLSTDPAFRQTGTTPATARFTQAVDVKVAWETRAKFVLWFCFVDVL